MGIKRFVRNLSLMGGVTGAIVGGAIMLDSMFDQGRLKQERQYCRVEDYNRLSQEIVDKEHKYLLGLGVIVASSIPLAYSCRLIRSENQ